MTEDRRTQEEMGKFPRMQQLPDWIRDHNRKGGYVHAEEEEWLNSMKITWIRAEKQSDPDGDCVPGNKICPHCGGEVDGDFIALQLDRAILRVSIQNPSEGEPSAWTVALQNLLGVGARWVFVCTKCQNGARP